MLGLTPKGWIVGAALQLALAVTALLAMAFAPGEAGRTLLVPIDGTPIDRAVLQQLMLRPLAPGPLPGSVIVDGRGRSLAGRLLGSGVIMLAAPAAMCGGVSATGSSRHG